MLYECEGFSVKFATVLFIYTGTSNGKIFFFLGLEIPIKFCKLKLFTQNSDEFKLFLQPFSRLQ